MKRSTYTLLILLFPFLTLAQTEEDMPVFEDVDVFEEVAVDTKPIIPARAKTGKPELFAYERQYGYALNDSILVQPKYKELEKPYADFMIARDARNYFGAINKKGELVLPFEYFSLSRTTAGPVLAGKQGLGYGLLDAQGEVLLPLEYRYGHKLQDSIVVLHSPGKQKIIKLLGTADFQVILEGEYEAIGKETTGNRPLFTVQENGLWGLMDYDKRLILPCVYDKIHSVYENQIVAEKDGKWGIVSFQGQMLVPFVHDRISAGLRYGYYRIGKSMPKSKWLYGLTDTTGRIVLPAEYESVDQLYYCDFFKISQNGKKGLVDTSGTLIVPIQFGDIYELKHPEWTEQERNNRFVQKEAYGLYVKTRHLDNELLGLWQLDKGEILKPAYESIEILQAGGLYALQKESKKALFNGAGKQLTGFGYSWLGYTPLHPELVTAGLPDQKTTLLHRSDGKPIEAESYDEIQWFQGTRSGYFATKKDRLSALHAPDGRRLTPHKYTVVYHCEIPATLKEVPPGRSIVACARIYPDQGFLFFALDDTGAEHEYTPN